MRGGDGGDPGAAFRSATYRGRPASSDGSVSLNENGTVMIRPSNSGTATWVATSSGDSPSSESAHASRDQVRNCPCRIGMSSAATALTSHPSSSPPADAFAGVVPPAARTVTTSASSVPNASSRSGGAVRRDEQNIGTATASPVASTASASAGTNAVFPDVWWAR